MFVNKFKFNIDTIKSGATETTVNIELTMDNQLVGQSDVIESVFVKKAIQENINPIIDYDKVRFLPLNNSNLITQKIRYALDMDGKTDYGSIGFTDDDLKFERNNFTESFLNLNFYDTDNPLDQKLISFITLYSEIDQNDLVQSNGTIGLGVVKPANQILLNFDIDNPLLSLDGSYEGFHLYDYKSDLKIGDSKYLYMRSSFKNAKSGKSTNLMTNNVAASIDTLIDNLYTRYILFRDSTGYYYKLDTSYSNNISFDSTTIKINLYEIKVL